VALPGGTKKAFAKVQNFLTSTNRTGIFKDKKGN
jgi:hypothetical protein